MKGWGLPGEDYMSREDGLAENHHYRDLRWMDWGDYGQVLRDCSNLKERARDGVGEDEMVELMGGEDNLVWSLDLDPEVAPAVAALAAAGAVPFTSCSGSEGHHEHHPLVAFWAPIEMQPMLMQAAERSGCCLQPTGLGSLLVWHDCHEALVDFGKQLRLAANDVAGGEE